MPLVQVILLSCSTMGWGSWCPGSGMSLDGDRSWTEHLDPAVTDCPSGQVATDQGVLVQSDGRLRSQPKIRQKA